MRRRFPPKSNDQATGTQVPQEDEPLAYVERLLLDEDFLEEEVNGNSTDSSSKG